MEFLDDLREQRKAGKQSPQKPSTVQESDGSDEDPWEALLGQASADEAGGAEPAVAQERRKKPRREKPRREKPRREKPERENTRRESTRRESTRGVKEKKTGRKNARRRLSGGQMVVLSVLAMLVIGLWIAIAAILSGALSLGGGGNANPIAADVGMVPIAEPEAATATVAPTPTAVRVEVGVTPTLEPTQTPDPRPAVSTVYDNQIMRDPDNIELYLKRGADYLSLKVFAGAFADYQVAVALDDQRPEAYIGLGWSQYYTFAWDEAEAAFTAAVALDKDAADAHFGLGLLHFHQGAYAQAMKDFDTAAEIDPLNVEAEAWLSMSAARAGDINEAVDAVNRALQLNQKLPVIYIARSASHRSQNPPNLEGAHGDLLYALGLGPNQFHTLNALAAFYAEHRPDRLSEAEVRAIHSMEWAANDVERALSLQVLGRVYLALDRKADAARVLTQAVELATVDGKTYLTGLTEDLQRAQ